jgi:hypothetical protein
MPNEKDILELELFEASSFMGIDKTKPVVIEFTKRKKNQNITEFESDQGTSKTSTLMGILYAMGGTFNLDKKKLMNTSDEAIDINLKFKYEGESYHVIAKTNRIELKKLNEDGKWKPEDSPVALLRKIFGPVGLSPFSVREMKGKDQIQFFQDMFGSGEDASKKMKKLEADIDTLFTQRRDVNRDAKAISSALEMEPLFQNYEKSLERFKKPVSAEKEKKVFEDADAKNKKYEQSNQALATINSDLIRKSNEIADLEKELAEAKKQLGELEVRKTNGEKWLKENKDVPKEFDAAQKAWMSLSTTLAEYEKWKSILAKEKTLTATQELAVQATGQLDALRLQLLKLTKQCLPKVEGLEIKVAAGLDKEGQQEGVFYNEQALHELSQSEYEGLWAKILVEAGSQFLFFENLNNFGSITIGVLNQLAKEGVQIFGTRTNPSIDEIGIAFKTKI